MEKTNCLIVSSVFLTSFLTAVFTENSLSVNNTKVCTLDATGTTDITDCNVPWRDTKLVLSCGAGSGQLFWAKGSVCRGVLDNTTRWEHRDGQTYTVNPDGRRLTYGDSGNYCCRNKSDVESVHVNILAPPELTNDVTECHGDDNDTICSNGNLPPLTFQDNDLKINVSFVVTGEFDVKWRHNGTDFTCANSQSTLGIRCYGLQNSTNGINHSQKLTLERFDNADGWKISGSFSAEVSNQYGSNTSQLHVKYNCVPIDPRPEKNNLTLNLTEGDHFTSSCSILSDVDQAPVICAYITRNANTSALKEQLLNSGNCVEPCCCNLVEGSCAACGRDGTCYQSSSNTTSIVVNRREDRRDYCSPLQLTTFASTGVLLSDNGQFLVCAYQNGLRTLHDKDVLNLQFYDTIQLRVKSRADRHVKLIVIGAVVSAVAVVLVVLVLAAIVVGVRRKHRGSALSSERTFVYSDEEDRCDEHNPLLGGKYEEGTHPALQQFEGSIGPVDFPYTLPERQSCSAIVRL